MDDPARLEKTRVFVVDPIDGTVAFMKGRPHFTICAAVVENGRPVAGVVFNPARTNVSPPPRAAARASTAISSRSAPDAR